MKCLYLGNEDNLFPRQVVCTLCIANSLVSEACLSLKWEVVVRHNQEAKGRVDRDALRQLPELNSATKVSLC